MNESEIIKFQQGYYEALCDAANKNKLYEKGKLLQKKSFKDIEKIKKIKINTLEW